MPELQSLVPPLVLNHLTNKEQRYLDQTFQRFSGYPGLEQIWQLMDEAWIELGCDFNHLDERITAFYQHPVWMLNGLFIEQHAQSLENRRIFADWILQQKPSRVADFGGGFGGLARIAGQAYPEMQIEVVEPHPHPAAIALAADTPNVRFMPGLTGEYDLLVATDVFEHVPDPLALTAETACHLRIGGQFLIANCFQPVIRCHLPQMFHFHYAWDKALAAMGLTSVAKVQYGNAYVREGNLDLTAARKVGEYAKRLQPLIQHLPRGKKWFGSMLVRWFC
jgi:hypothetical protein